MNTAQTAMVRILRAAREKIKEGWCQNGMAKDGDGNPADPTDSSAVSWCAYGAIAAVDNGANFGADFALRNAVGASVVRWNDNVLRTKDEVLSMFDKAIRIAKGEA